MSVVNIQDAYAKALIIDRDALRAASVAGDVLGGHQALLDAYNTDVRPLCASARRALGAARRSNRGAACVRALPAHRGRARRNRMSAATELIASASDLWPSNGGPSDPLAALVRASNLLGADRAVSNFGGGNTSAKGGRRRPHRHGALGHVGQGLGQRSRHDGTARASPRCVCRRCCR